MATFYAIVSLENSDYLDIVGHLVVTIFIAVKSEDCHIFFPYLSYLQIKQKRLRLYFTDAELPLLKTYSLATQHLNILLSNHFQRGDMELVLFRPYVYASVRRPEQLCA